jgi:hypothetical protein
VPHNVHVAKKYHRTPIPAIFLVVVLLVAVSAAAWAAQYTRNSSYWWTAAGVMVTLAAGVLGLVKRAADQHLGDHLDQAADTLARTVKKQWLDELGHKLTNPHLNVPFGVTADTRKIMDTWTGSGRKGKMASLDGTSASIADVFMRADVPPRLVVLGDPGSGKSVIAQMLTIELLERREAKWPSRKRSVKQRIVPVCFAVAGWNPKEDDLDSWVAAQLADNYPSLAEIIQAGDGTACTLASELVAERRVLVILDGLDEMPRKHQAAALTKLSAAVEEDHCVVVTCRTKTYHKIVAKAGRLSLTPVVELSPLPVASIRAHFQGTPQPAQWHALIRHLKRNPDGVLAGTLSSPLAIWLVRTVYHNRGGDAVELTGKGSSDEIMQHLLGGLVEAVYTRRVSKSYPKRGKRQTRDARRTLTYLARNLAGKKGQDIAWWRLHEKVPKRVIGITVGFIVGSVLGVAVGIAVSIKAGTHAAIIYGGVFAVATGVLSGITCVRPQPSPRLVNLKFISWKGLPKRLAGCLSVGLAVGLAFGYAANHGGGLRAGLIVAAIVGPVCAAAASPVFGLAPGITAGVTASLALGLAAGLESGRPAGTVAGPIAGLVFMASSWVWIGIYQTAEAETAPSPAGLLRSDRNGSLVVGATAGIAFGVVYGLALGALVGAIAVAALFVSVVITVSLWGTFSVARVWLAVHEDLPLRIMGFLHEAHARGLLRQVGGAYQFRHDLLRRQLAAPGDRLRGRTRPALTAAAGRAKAQRAVVSGQNGAAKAPRLAANGQREHSQAHPVTSGARHGNERNPAVRPSAQDGNGRATRIPANRGTRNGARKAQRPPAGAHDGEVRSAG